jgi:hypothetical protein
MIGCNRAAKIHNTRVKMVNEFTEYTKKMAGSRKRNYWWPNVATEAAFENQWFKFIFREYNTEDRKQYAYRVHKSHNVAFENHGQTTYLTKVILSECIPLTELHKTPKECFNEVSQRNTFRIRIFMKTTFVSDDHYSQSEVKARYGLGFLSSKHSLKRLWCPLPFNR